MVLAGAVMGALVVWASAPWVSMARRRTIDQRTVASWHEVGLPVPRTPTDDVPVRRPTAQPEVAGAEDR